MNKKDNRMQMEKELESFELPEHIMEVIEKLQQEAFMDGYRYAISLLQESIPKTEREI